MVPKGNHIKQLQLMAGLREDLSTMVKSLTKVALDMNAPSNSPEKKKLDMVISSWSQKLL